MIDSPLLAVDALSVRYGGVQALRDVTLRVRSGELVGVIGPNGAGKSSLLDAISGFTPLTGALTFDRQDITGRRPHDRARMGLARTWQTIQLFDELTVAENVQVAQPAPGLRRLLRDLLAPSRASLGQAHAALDRLGIGALADRMPGELSHGQQVLVGVARALAAEPRLVLMDEPAAGLDLDERARLGPLLRELADAGTSIVLVDHDMDLVLGVCDRIYVLDFGVVIAHGPPAAIRGDAHVIAAYLGVDESTPDETAPDESASDESAPDEAANNTSGSGGGSR